MLQQARGGQHIEIVLDAATCNLALTSTTEDPGAHETIEISPALPINSPTNTPGAEIAVKAIPYHDEATLALSGINTVSTDPIRDYRRQITRTPLLRAEQEVWLAQRIEAGVFAQEKLDVAAANGKELDGTYKRELTWLSQDGQQALDHMSRANLRLVMAMARPYRGKGVPLLDLIQEGNLSLLTAVQKFDYQKGYKFSTYAKFWIGQALSRAVANHSRVVRVSIDMHNKIKGYVAQRNLLYGELSREPSPAEIAAKLTWSADELSKVQQAMRSEPVSLHISFDDEHVEFGHRIEDADTLDPEECVVLQERSEILWAALDCLTAKERAVVVALSGLDGNRRTVLQLSKELEMPVGTVHSSHFQAMHKLRRSPGLVALVHADT